MMEFLLSGIFEAGHPYHYLHFIPIILGVPFGCDIVRGVGHIDHLVGIVSKRSTTITPMLLIMVSIHLNVEESLFNH
jgi:hypothetical protein